MTKEIYHEGWLIKSPPTKRIWRARWRRRWFTLKQGEIPEQFCLEYYKDRSCRKLKGIIDLDQCEQVDSGLRLEHRKPNFQYMFDVKTPSRTYYLAANSEEDMNAWVNCICEVCNLQDLSKPQQPNTTDGRQYYNVTSELVDNQASGNSSISPVKSNASEKVALLPTAEPIDNNNSVYQNYDAMCRNSNYNNRETLICDVPLNKNETKDGYYNFMAIAKTVNRAPLSNDSIVSKGNQKNGAHRKIPENLKLNSGILTEMASTSTSTPTLMTTNQTTRKASGPYIAISDCISGNPLIDRENPTTPLNSLDPKFYDTPRSHFNIGLNLTNEQPYSPKRNNIPTLPSQMPQSGKSSPTDSESVFTDDEEWIPTNPNDSTNGERCMRPSESSVENDSLVFTYTQRFSKMKDDDSIATKRVYSKRPLPVTGLSLEKTDSEEQNKDINSSDTENASPAIAYGPKDINSYVDESYDIPRSHQLPYIRHSDINNDSDMELGASGTSSSMLELEDLDIDTKVASNVTTEVKSATMPNRNHYYTNAAPTKVEGNVFRYDFDDKQMEPAPAVDRKLKPKLQHEENDSKLVTPSKVKSVPSVKTKAAQPTPTDLIPPSIDRKLKPTTPIKLETSTLQRRGIIPSATDAEFQGGYNTDQISKTLPRNYNNSASIATPTLFTMPTTPIVLSTQPAAGRQTAKLEYCDLDHANPPPICNNSNTSASTSNLNAHTSNLPWQSNNLANRLSGVSITSSVFGNQSTVNDATIGGNALNSGTASGGGGTNPSTASGVVYKSVDFIKTEAFMRTRQDAEMARAKNRSKE